MSYPADDGLNEETRDLRAVVERFARERVAPQIAVHDEACSFPYEIVAEMGQIGLFGLPFPEELGGGGGDLLALCVAIEELARVDSSVAITLDAAVSLGAMPIYRFGSEAQKQRWLPELCTGEKLAAFGLTEPDGGSDAGAIRTTANLVDDYWVLNGSKAFITNSGTRITSLVTVAARTGPQLGASGSRDISTVIVPSGTAGFSVSPSYSKVGWHSSDTHELSFMDCAVPQDHLLGVQGKGYSQFLSILDEGRVCISALSVGLAQGCLDESVNYAKQRYSFGAPIGSKQAVAFKIADMDVRVHTARLAWRDAAERAISGRPFKRQASIAKLYASEAAVANARDATQIFGGYGFMNESPVARYWRDCKILEIGEGTSEVQRMLIARELGL